MQSRPKVFRLSEQGYQEAEVRCYAPGNGELGFVVIDLKTDCAISPGPTEAECRALLPEGWELYHDGYWRARKIEPKSYSEETMRRYLPQFASRAKVENMQDLTDAEIDRVFAHCVMGLFCVNAMKQFRSTGGTLESLFQLDQ